MVVIAIIGILSGIGIVNFSGSITRAQEAEVTSYLKELKDTIRIAQIDTGLYLGEITGDYCTVCGVCTGGIDLRNIDTTHACYVDAQDSITKIEEATRGVVTNLADNIRDPWGSPYLMDENEYEPGFPPCRQDYIVSVGPDGIFGNGDDIRETLAFSRVCP